MAGVIGVEEEAVLKVVQEDARSLELLDDYGYRVVYITKEVCNV